MPNPTPRISVTSERMPSHGGATSERYTALDSLLAAHVFDVLLLDQSVALTCTALQAAQALCGPAGLPRTG